MPTIEVLIRSKYIPQGSQAALQDFTRIQQSLVGLVRSQQALDQASREGLNVAISKDAILQTLQYTDGIRGLVREATRMESTFRKSALSAVEMGDALKGSNLNAVADQYARVRQFGEKLQQNIAGTTQEWKGFNGILKDLLMPINQVGFALFLITQNLRTLQIIADAAFQVLEEGASRTDVLLAFNRLTEQAGLNTGNLAKRLNEASDGLIGLQVAQASVNRAILAGLPQLANASPALLNMAKSVAIATGNIDNLEHIYSTLLLGILRGSPRLIDNADIYIKLGDANEKYAESLGKSVEELTEQEKQLAVLNAVLAQQADVLALAGEEVDSHAARWVSFKNSLNEAKASLFTLVEFMASSPFGKGGFGLIEQSDIDLLHEFRKALLGIGALFIQFTNMATLPFELLRASISETLPILQGVGTAIEALSNGEFATFSSVVDELKQSLSDLANLPSDIIDINAEETAAEIAELIKALGFTFQTIEEGARNSGIGDAFLGPLDQIIASLQFIGSEEYQLQRDLLDSWNDYRERLEQIEQDKNDRLIELRESLNERLTDLDEDLADRQQEINEDLAETLADIESDSNQDMAEENEDYHESIEKAEEDHQKRINDILRRFELARLRAVIDRDARALFEAERQRDEALEEENDSFEDKLHDLEENHQEEIARIEEQEEEKRQRAIEAAEERRQDAIDQYNEARAEAIENYEEQRQDALEAYAEARADATKAAKDRENDLKKSYAERLYIAEAGEKLKLAMEARAQLESEENMFDYFMGLREQIVDYYDFLKQYEDYEFPFAPNPDDVPSLPGGGDNGGGSDGPPSGGNPPGPSPCGSGPGGTVPCNTPNQLYTCGDGSKYVCIGGVWRRTFGGANSSISSPSQSSSFTNAVGTNSVSSGQQRVIIQVTGDKTLEQIFKEISYSTIIETLQ